MNLSAGIVGLPNAGKSTLFNALLQKQQALAANYPFATIEPNIGIVPINDPRLKVLANIVKTEKIIPSVIKFYDIAGLVAGAHSGEGLGNQFLSHIREVDLIVHVLRYFTDANVVQTGAGPQDDYETVKTELILKDLETISKQVEPKGKVEPEDKIRWQAVQKVKQVLEKGEEAKHANLTDEEAENVKSLFLLTMKPSVFVLNISEADLPRQTEIQAELADLQPIIICAKLESELAEFSDTEKADYLNENGLSETGLDRLTKNAFEKLGLTSFLTAGEKEVRSWTIAQGTKAPQAAGVIHTDFEKSFIRAQVISFQDFVANEGWSKAREKGLVRTEGKDYIMKPDDVVEFLTSA